MGRESDKLCIEQELSSMQFKLKKGIIGASHPLEWWLSYCGDSTEDSGGDVSASVMASFLCRIQIQGGSSSHLAASPPEERISLSPAWITSTLPRQIPKPLTHSWWPESCGSVRKWGPCSENLMSRDGVRRTGCPKGRKLGLEQVT